MKSFSPRKLFFWLIIPVIVLELLYVTFYKIQSRIPFLFPYFNLTAEENFPTWYSATILGLVAVVAFTIFALRTKKMKPHAIAWLLLGGLYAYLSMDEYVQIHEQTQPYVFSNWVYGYAPLVLLVLIGMMPFFWSAKEDKLFRWIPIGFMCSAIISIVGEFLATVVKLPSFWAKIEIMVEEGGEMVGGVIVLVGCVFSLVKLLKNRNLLS